MVLIDKKIDARYIMYNQCQYGIPILVILTHSILSYQIMYCDYVIETSGIEKHIFKDISKKVSELGRLSQSWCVA